VEYLDSHNYNLPSLISKDKITTARSSQSKAKMTNAGKKIKSTATPRKIIMSQETISV